MNALVRILLPAMAASLVLVAGLAAQSAPAAPAPSAALVPALPARAAVSPANLERAKAYLAEWYRRTPHPGVSVAFATAEGTLWAGAWGLADLDTRTPMSADTVVPIGSLTKSFTALAVMQLVEQGKIELDAPVVRYLPWFRLADKAVSDRITVRHCLNNASGIPSRDTWSQAGRSLSEAEIERDVRALAAVKSRGEPGTFFEYVNENWEILGLIIKTLTGSDYGAWMRDRVFKPLGMNTTTTELDRIDAVGSITGSLYGADGFMEARRGWSAGGLPAGSCTVSTARDLGAYLACLLNRGVSPITGATLVRPETLETLWKPTVQFPAVPAEARGGDKPGWYAMGWIRAEADGRPLVFHGGNIMRTSSMTVLDPTTGLGASMLLNSPGDLDRYRYASSLAALNGALRLLAGQMPSDWGSMLVPDPNLSEPFTPQPDAWLDAMAGVWVSPEGFQLTISRPTGAAQLTAAIESPLFRQSWHIDFIDRGRAVLSNLAGTMKIKIDTGSDGRPRRIDGLLGFSFKPRLTTAAGMAALRFAGIESVLPQTWKAEIAPAGFLARRDGAVLRGGLVPGRAPTAELADRLSAALAAAGWSGKAAGFRPEAVNGAWSGPRYWESLTVLSAPAQGLVWCETPKGLVWLAIEAPAGELTRAWRDTVRPFLESLTL